ncbi:MAG TPA: enoyl-CoA hydratase-related protein [Bacteroidia bacterium]|nr:enoyl-CoA hydratase-related protein [Bacteroidia bacterium]
MELIHFEIVDNVAKIKLNRPEKFNSFNREMALQLQKKLDVCEADKNIRAVFLYSEGKAFCAGQDLAEAIDKSGPGIEQIVREHYNPIILKIRNIEKPFVCAVNGVAAGAGASLALACDIVIAANSAAFIQAFGKIGLIPDSGGTYFLPRYIGLQKAAALMMLGEKIMAKEAQEMGMIYKAFDDAVFLQEGLNIANTLANLPTRGIGLTKHLLNKSMSNTLEQQLDLEAVMQVKAAKTVDHQEGVKAFFEKRKPEFKGE